MDKLLELIKEKQDLLNRPLIIGIDGRCGSGKTTLSNYLKSVLDCEIIRMDHFFLQVFQRTDNRLKEIGGNFDYERFILEVKNPINNKKDISYQVFNCSTMRLEERINININKIIVIEGTYSLHPLIEDIYDIKVFVNIDKDKQINRIKIRDGEILLKRFIGEWIPKEEDYFLKFNILNNVDLIIKN
jgi:uridine kinase